METNDATPATSSIAKSSAKICPACGYLHVLSSTSLPDVCEWCKAPLVETKNNLFRMQNVSTRRIDRINSDEEERSRIGYNVVTSIRFSEQGGAPRCVTATVAYGEKKLARISYGPAALIWRINTGWRRSLPGTPEGFVLDVERGYWARNQVDTNDADGNSNPMSQVTERVVPYVEDRRNCLLIKPELPDGLEEDAATAWMASFEAAFKSAIREEFQLEDSELATEPMPGAERRELILVYEAAEGGAGVLRQLVEDHGALPRVAKTALEICHYDPEDGTDQGGPVDGKEGCEAACYDCLMSYTNQQDHERLDRTLVKDWFLMLSHAEVEHVPGAESKENHLAKLLAACGSELERKWLRFLDERGYTLPSHAQYLVNEAKTRPDFAYADFPVAVYIDGPIHDYPDRAARDKIQETALEDLGYTVLRFAHDAEWESIIQRYPSVFGGGRL